VLQPKRCGNSREVVREGRFNDSERLGSRPT
jgi:hypothetical protein